MDARTPQVIKTVPIPHAPDTPPIARTKAAPAAAQGVNNSDAEALARVASRRAYPQNIADRPIPRIGDQPWLISESWLKQHERQLSSPNRSQAKVVFLGDSITAGWRGSSAYREAFAQYKPLNLGVAGDHTQNVLWRIKQGALKNLAPSVLVLLVGVNNLGGGFSAEKTASGVRAIVAAVQEHLPRTRILLLGILPAREKPDASLRAKIAAANRLLAQLAEPGRVDYHDLGSVFLQPDGTISKDVMRDFLHPTPVGYERLSASVGALLAPLVNR